MKERDESVGITCRIFFTADEQKNLNLFISTFIVIVNVSQSDSIFWGAFHVIQKIPFLWKWIPRFCLHFLYSGNHRALNSQQTQTKTKHFSDIQSTYEKMWMYKQKWPKQTQSWLWYSQECVGVDNAHGHSGKAQMTLALFGGLQWLRPHVTAADWLFLSPTPVPLGAAVLQVGP